MFCELMRFLDFIANCDNEGMSCVCLHGDRRPQERKANLEAFKVNVKFLRHSYKACDCY